MSNDTNTAEIVSQAEKIPYISNSVDTAAQPQKVSYGSNTADGLSAFSEISQPPSYNSINFIKNLKNADKKSKSPVHFVSTASVIFCGSLVATVSLLLLLLILIVTVIIINLFLVDSNY
jgi:hypothetical protein